MNADIPYSADVEKMGFYRAPLAQYRPSSIGATAFAKLWKAIKTGVLEEGSDGC
jgi:hypothetical protein